MYKETGPYDKGKIARYYIARSKERVVQLPVNPELGKPEHQEAAWVGYEKALEMVTARLKPVVQWAYAVVNHDPAQASSALRPAAGR